MVKCLKKLLLIQTNEIPAKMISIGSENWLNDLLYNAPDSNDKDLIKGDKGNWMNQTRKFKSFLPGTGVLRSDKSLANG